MLLKPVLPYVSDFLAHAFWKYEHIATVHKENGKTHIHYELQQAAKENGTDKSNAASNMETSVTPHVMSLLAYDFSLLPVRQSHWPAFIFYLPSVKLSGNYPPPKA
ncbi:MAG: hypothetical protein ABIX01_20920 [Chitinophagaceae bacterium]